MNTPRMIDIPIVEIDPEFRDLIPVLTADEKEALEASLLKEGCRDALVLWDGKLLDGHSRHEICKRHDIPFKTHSMTFDDRDAAKIWIISNQLARRNLTPFQRDELIGIRYLLEKKEHGVRGPKKSDQNEHSFKTAESISRETGVSPATVRRNAQFAEAIAKMSPGERAEVLAGKSDKTKQEIIDGPIDEREIEGTMPEEENIKKPRFDSMALSNLKTAWNEASRSDQKKFLAWAKKQIGGGKR